LRIEGLPQRAPGEVPACRVRIILTEYGQAVSSKIWIAATSALALLYFWQDIKKEK
jgi:hypothetical protein